jgi:hypothetical protein
VGIGSREILHENGGVCSAESCRLSRGRLDLGEVGLEVFISAEQPFSTAFKVGFGRLQPLSYLTG